MTGPLVGIVGPCSAGKTTLGNALRARGYHIKEILQEHSFAPSMWQRLTHPDILIYLDVTMEEAARREGLAKPYPWWEEERRERLAHARQHCDLYVETTRLSPQEILTRVIAFLETDMDEGP
jgi:thymidylate kinase